MGKASRAKRQRRHQHAAAQQSLAESVRRSYPEARVEILNRPPGRKVSEMLIEFAEPWLDMMHTNVQRENVLKMAVLAWNLACIPEPKRWQGTGAEILAAVPEPGVTILKEMIVRKLGLFPEQTQMIFDYVIKDSEDRLSVDVVYAPLGAKKDPNPHTPSSGSIGGLR